MFPADDTVDALELEVVLDSSADGDHILVELVFVVPRRRAGLGDLQLNRHALFSSIHLKVRSREIRIDPESALKILNENVLGYRPKLCKHNLALSQTPILCMADERSYFIKIAVLESVDTSLLVDLVS